MTSPLSPAAQTVLDAFFTGDWEDEPLHSNIAAALRAAALCCKRDQLQLLAIADELEGH
jgi:hypothetical protein